MCLFPSRFHAAVVAAATAVVVAATGAPAPTAPPEGTVRPIAGETIKDSYIVVLDGGTVARSATGSTALAKPAARPPPGTPNRLCLASANVNALLNPRGRSASAEARALRRTDLVTGSSSA